MTKFVYISADYDEYNGDRDVVEMITRWGADNLHKVNFIDMAQVRSGSVSEGSDCRICDLKAEFNRQINRSSAVIFVVGDKTGSRVAGNRCERNCKEQYECECVPYKKRQLQPCKVGVTIEPTDDIGNINQYSYLQHEFEQAEKKEKKIIIFYNSMRKESDWLPSYMRGYEDVAEPFWIRTEYGKKGNYEVLKEKLGF